MDIKTKDNVQQTLKVFNFKDLKFPMIATYFNTGEYENRYVARVIDTIPEIIPTDGVVVYNTLEGMINDLKSVGFKTFIPREMCDDVNLLGTYSR